MYTLSEKFTAWLASKGGFAHVVAVVYAGAVLAYAAVPAFQQLCNSVYADFPAWAHEVLLAVFGLIAWYKTNAPAGKN